MKVGDTRTGLPATRTERDARERESPRGEERAGNGPDRPDLPRAPCTHDQGTALAKTVVARSAMHQP